MRPYVSDLYWFPRENLNMNKVKDNFTVDLGEVYDSDEEDYLESILDCYRVEHKHGSVWVGLPKGDPKLVRSCLVDKKDWTRIRDKQVDAPVKMKLRFNGTFRPEQLKAIEAMVEACKKKGGGILKSAPRTGKTIMGTEIALRLGQKALIVAHQTDLIEQFCNETINDPKENLFNGITLRKREAGICKNLADFQRYDICLVTYQTFLSSRGQKLLKKVANMFGTVVIDEVHRTPATRYSQILSRMKARYFIGLSATPDRKDGKMPCALLLIGPIRHSTKMKSLRATVYGRDTALNGVVTKNPPKTWNGMMNYLFRHKKRNESIARTAVRDVKRGHIVLIPTVLKAHQETLAEMINKHAGEKICFIFNGSIPKTKRQQTRDMINSDKKIKVLIATRSMLTGLNIPRLSAIYTVAPISNNPNYEQEVMRVCTPKEGKRKPIIRYFMDGTLGVSYGCLTTCKKLLENGDYDLHPSFKRIAVNERPGKKEYDEFEVAESPGSKRRKLF